MREEYDFSNGIKNPYATTLKSKKVVTIRIEDETIDYFKKWLCHNKWLIFDEK
ncbi:hypothetical protein Q7381_07105 [Glaesserella parasuis]|nr:hypothetical protein [Glaesserella parasuis]MDP0120135.1 hypothetical protein [Glaesserella parasuis]